MPNQRKPRWRRWTRRVLIVLIAGVLLTVASSWVLQSRGFVVSRQVQWVQGPPPGFVTFGSPAAGLYDSGDGVWIYDDSVKAWPPQHPAPQHTATQPAEILWTLHSIDWRGTITWSAERNRWDALAPIEGYNGLSEILHREPNRGYSFYGSAWYTYASANQPPAWLSEARKLAPSRAKHTSLTTQEVLAAGPFLDQTTGWVAASAFRPVPGFEVDSSIPVERWSAQRAGWPMHAMMTEQYAIGPRPPIERVQDMPLISLRHGLKGGLILHHQPQHPMLHPLGHHSLPLMPLWPGFATNTAFYAACIATLWLTIGGGLHLLGTKKRRRKRGLCESCGYDIQDLTTCPECGNARSTNQRS